MQVSTGKGLSQAEVQLARGYCKIKEEKLSNAVGAQSSYRTMHGGERPNGGRHKEHQQH